MRTNATRLLTDASRGDEAAAARLLPFVYDELRDLAARYLARGPGAQPTLQPTVLVHEAFLRLAGGKTPDVNSQTHFHAIAAVAMRHVLIDHARGKKRVKRGGGRNRLTMSDTLAVTGKDNVDLIDLGEALEKLSKVDPRAVRVIELRFFGGLTEKEVADELTISERTVRNDWKMAQAWLRCELGGDEMGLQ